MGTGSLLMDRHRLEANRVNTVRDFESFSHRTKPQYGHHQLRRRAAQNAGNLKIVVVGWNDSTATVATVTDSKANASWLPLAAIGPRGRPDQERH